MSAPATILAGFLLLLSLTQAAQALDASAQVGRVSAVEGEVEISYGEDSDAWEAATVNFPVAAGARISAGPSSRAAIGIGASAARVDGEALLDVVTLEDRLVQLRLDQGALSLALRDLARDARFELATPHASVSIAVPGSYRIDADPAGSTRVSVRSGEALVRSDAGEVLLKSGRGVEASQAGLFEFDADRAYALDDFDRWSHALEAADTGSYSSNVPRAVTGYEELDRGGTWSSYSGYGTVWTPSSAYDWWEPYTYGYWTWVPPWGWTWVDQAPWAFATFRFGSWTFLDRRWWWAPGALWPRPVFSAFVPFHPGQVLFTTSSFVHGKPAHHFVPLKPKKVLAVKRPWPAHGSWRTEGGHAHGAAGFRAGRFPVTPATTAPAAAGALPARGTVLAPDTSVRGRVPQGFLGRSRDSGARPVPGFFGSRPGAQGLARETGAAFPGAAPEVGRLRGNGGQWPGAALRPSFRTDPSPAVSGEAPVRAEGRAGFGRGDRALRATPGMEHGRWQAPAVMINHHRPSLPLTMGGVPRGETAAPFRYGGGRGDSGWRGERRSQGSSPAMASPARPAAGVGSVRGGGGRR